MYYDRYDLLLQVSYGASKCLSIFMQQSQNTNFNKTWNVCTFLGYAPFSKQQLNNDEWIENIMLIVFPFECLDLVLECYFASSQL